MASGFVIFFAAALVFIAAYISFPAPALTTRLLEWKNKGNTFKWKTRDIFFVALPGSGNAGNVICLHGFPTSSYDWIKILPQLQEDFEKVVMLDFLGAGFSDKPEDITYTISEQADIVLELARRQNIKTAHILAHDVGDTVALELLSRFNKGQLDLQMQSLTLLNGGIFPETNHPRLGQKLILHPVFGCVASYLFNFVFFSRGMAEIFGVNKPLESDHEDFWAALRYKNGDRATCKIINFLRERQQFKDKWVGALQTTKLKVLMIYGPGDPVNPPPFPTHFRKMVPSQKIVTLDPGVGHYPQCEDPDGVSKAFHEFISSLK